MDSKDRVLQELLPLMAANGVEERILSAMREADWIAAVSLENLEFLLRQHRELRERQPETQRLYERWRASKERPPEDR